MNLVWHAEGLIEVDWVRYIFGDIVDVEVTDLNRMCLDDDSIHVVSST